MGNNKPKTMAIIRLSDSPPLMGNQEGDHLLQIGVDGAPLAHGLRDGGEIVVGQKPGRSLARRLAALAAHGVPASARFSAGASLTPSAVMATTCPWLCSAVTRAQFVFGAGCARRCRSRSLARAQGSVVELSISAPVSTSVCAVQSDHRPIGSGRAGVVPVSHALTTMPAAPAVRPPR